MPYSQILGCLECLYAGFIDDIQLLCYNADRAFPIAKSLRSHPRSRSEN